MASSNRRFLRFLRLLIFISALSIFLTFVIFRHLNFNLKTISYNVVDSEIEMSYYIEENAAFQRGHEGSDKFQVANHNGSSTLLLAFSAYWDNRTEPTCARLIVITSTKNPPPMFCQFQIDYRTLGPVITIPGNRTLIMEHRKLKYAAQFVNCCLKESRFKIFPQYLRFFNPMDKFNGVRLRLHRNPPPVSNQKQYMALCVKPMHSGYNDVKSLMEFIEYYLLMGVRMFHFYVSSAGPDVQVLLDKYQQQGIVNVLEWDIHGIKSRKEIWTQGLFGAFNECLYRSMGIYKYLVNVDVDEFIILKKHNNFHELLSDVLKNKSQCYSGAVFKNEFFYRFLNDSGVNYSNQEQLPYLVTERKITKLKAHYQYGNRSKYIAIPENDQEIGNHYIYRPMKGCKMAFVPTNVATLHHYRSDCERLMEVCLRRNYTEDRSAHRFLPQLRERVKKRCLDFPRRFCYS